MKVLFVYKTYLPHTKGGIEQFMFQMGYGGARHGIESTVLSTNDRPADDLVRMNGHTACYARTTFEFASTPFSTTLLGKFRSLAKRADIIHYQFPWPFMDAMHFAARISKPTVVTYHSDIVRQELLLHLYGPLQRRFLRSVDRVVATSPIYTKSSTVLRDYAEKLTVIPIGIDRASYPEASQERLNYWRRRVGERFFLFVGVLRYYKGLHFLVEAAKATGCPILIVGDGPTGDALKAQAARTGTSNVRLLGYLSDADKVALLTLCYGVVCASHLRSEAFCISLLEGAMFGKPLVSSEINTGTSYVNIHGETGLVVPPGDAQALSEAMQFLLDHPDRAQVFGHNAQARYQSLFTSDQMIGSYAAVYRDLLEAGSRRSSDRQDSPDHSRP